MKKSINTCVLAALLFYFLMVIASLFSSKPYYPVLYATSFALPVAAVLIPSRMLGAKTYPLGMGIDAKRAAFVLLIALPVLGAVMLLSFATSQLMALGGFSNELVISEPLPYALLLYAIIPSVGEELVFRYVPLRLIGAHSKRSAVIISALLFSLAHANLFQIPYAFFAGVAFALIDLTCESVLPSVLLHLFNNVLGVLFAVFEGSTFVTVLIVAFAALAFVSALFIIARIKRYFDKFSSIISHGPLCFTAGTVLFSAFMLTLSALSLVANA